MRVLVLLAVLASRPSGASVCVSDIWDNGTAQSGIVFPNWVQVKAGSFDVLLCDGCPGAAENITALTIVNFGTAAGADIKAVYWKAECGATSTGLQTMTYGGNYQEDSGTYPAWTWKGSSVSMAACAAMWVGGPGYFTLSVYVDVGSCPTPQGTIAMGLPIHQAADPVWWGSLYDGFPCAVPWGDLAGPVQTVLYVYKEADSVTAAPGDTVTYTIYYGRPGTANLANVVIMDTQPAYTHWTGVASVPPDPGWDPDPGPPLALRWTIPGPLAVAGGPTGMVSFQLTVDWGNGEAFEPGSGDVAAPEGARLNNQAQVFFGGIAGCAMTSAVNAPVTTVVRRFFMWQIGDNDVLFSPTYGQPPDEMIYSVFIKNPSAQKTWWGVRLWDSVPPELNVWCAGCGFDDPCTGWTMTPSGCAAASPGRTVGAAKTILTWKLDMPPGTTLELRWKAQVGANAASFGTAINTVSVLEWGRAGISGGTGHSGVPRTFTHLARIVLPTMYISYVSFAADAQHSNKGQCPGFIMDLFPLNKKTQFALYGLEYEGPGWGVAGGVSASMGSLIGDCLGGFPGGAGISGGGQAGCKAERIPAYYDPAGWHAICPVWPAHFIYKLVSNSPVLWQLLTWGEPSAAGDVRDDNNTPAPSSSLSYAGLIHYFYRRDDPQTSTAGTGDSISLINTSVDAYGVAQPSLPTTVHLFRFDYASLQWEYVRTYELGHESQAYDMGTDPATQGPWRTVSSDGQLIVYHGFDVASTLGCCCTSCGNNFETYMVARDSGNVVSPSGHGSMYGLVNNSAWSAKVVIGNLGAVNATYEIWKYIPDSLVAKAPMPVYLNGTSGSWVVMAHHNVPAGLAAAGNPRVYASYSNDFDGTSTALYKVKLLSGGPIQVLHGAQIYISHSGGVVMHAADGKQTGTEFWLHLSWNTGAGQTCPDTSSLQGVDMFCSKKGMAVRAVSSAGYAATYTTSGPDQCVSFGKITELASPNTVNYKFTVLPGPTSGDVITMFSQCLNTQKGYTAPFLQTGVHYQIIMPPIVFQGQSFWITVVVVEAGGNTKMDYTGTTAFTATDPGARIQAVAMGGYDYTWTAPDAGVRMFFNVTMTQIGVQTVVAIDVFDGSVTGLAATLVVAADVKLWKEPAFAVAASGDTVRFRICWSNYSSASAFTFVVTDAVPMGMTFVPEASSAGLNCGNTDGVPLTVAYATATTPAAPPAASFTDGNPVGGTRWLRWTAQSAGVQTTGCACFRATID